jgi:hypothetical protein
MESGVATWNECYKNWRVFSPCSAQTSGGLTEHGYLHSAPFASINAAIMPKASPWEKSGHAIDTKHKVSFNPHTVESDIAH